MTKSQIVLILGVIILIMPFLGFPRMWKTSFYVAAGLALITLALVQKIKRQKSEKDVRQRNSNDVFVENRDSATPTTV